MTTKITPPTPAQQRERCAMYKFRQATRGSLEVARIAPGYHLLLVAALVVATVFAAVITATCREGLLTNAVAFTPAIITIGSILLNLACSFRALQHIDGEWKKKHTTTI